MPVGLLKLKNSILEAISMSILKKGSFYLDAENRDRRQKSWKIAITVIGKQYVMVVISSVINSMYRGNNHWNKGRMRFGRIKENKMSKRNLSDTESS